MSLGVVSRRLRAVHHAATLAAVATLIAVATACSAGGERTAASPTAVAATAGPTSSSIPIAPPTTAVPTVPSTAATTATSTASTASTASTTAHPTSTSVPAPTLPTTTLPGTTSTSPTSTSTSTTLPPIPPADGEPLRVEPTSWELTRLTATAAALTGGSNRALSVSVWRDGRPVFGAAAGRTNAGGRAATTTPFVVASVSKLVTALSVARLAQEGRLDATGAVPWTAMGIPHDPAWDAVTIGQLLGHTAGMPVAQSSWLDLPGSCAVPLADALARPPRDHAGERRYSNGNYCALGLVVEHVAGAPLDLVAAEHVFGPVGVPVGPTGAHLVTTGPLPGDAPYTNGRLGVERLQRLGGAGTWVASTEAIARMLAAVTPADRSTLAYPAVMQDQYGWGHTGTVDGARACAWSMEDDRTVLAAAVSGGDPGSGSELCDLLVPALAIDLGIYEGEPVRIPA